MMIWSEDQCFFGGRSNAKEQYHNRMDTYLPATAAPARRDRAVVRDEVGRDRRGGAVGATWRRLSAAIVAAAAPPLGARELDHLKHEPRRRERARARERGRAQETEQRKRTRERTREKTISESLSQTLRGNMGGGTAHGRRHRPRMGDTAPATRRRGTDGGEARADDR